MTNGRRCFIQRVLNASIFYFFFFLLFVEGRMAEWLRYWNLNHEIVGSSPAIH